MLPFQLRRDTPPIHSASCSFGVCGERIANGRCALAFGSARSRSNPPVAIGRHLGQRGARFQSAPYCGAIVASGYLYKPSAVRREPLTAAALYHGREGFIELATRFSEIQLPMPLVLRFLLSRPHVDDDLRLYYNAKPVETPTSLNFCIFFCHVCAILF